MEYEEKDPLEVILTEFKKGQLIDIQTGEKWNPKLGFHCWWDCGVIFADESPLPIAVARVSPKSDDIYVQGWCCSANCVKGYILSSSGSDKIKRSRLGLQQTIYREHFNLVSPMKNKKITEDLMGDSFGITAAPAPHMKIKMFRTDGMSLECYRKTYCQVVDKPRGE